MRSTPLTPAQFTPAQITPARSRHDGRGLGRAARAMIIGLALTVAVTGTAAAAAAPADDADRQGSATTAPAESGVAESVVDGPVVAESVVVEQVVPEPAEGASGESEASDEAERQANPEVDEAPAPGTVAGRVTAAAPGLSTRGFTVTLLDAVTLAPADGGTTQVQVNGSYELRAAPGEYFLEVTPVGGANARSVYYPSAARVEQAETIQVDQAGMHTGLDLQTPLARVVPGRVTFTGTVRTGGTLTASASGYLPADAAVSYQWYRGSSPIAGANQRTYRVAAADVAQKIRVRATGTAPGLDREHWDSATQTPSRAALRVGTVTVTGTARVGVRLTATTGSWNAGARFTYQWFADGRQITGQTQQRYTVRAADRGKRITVRATGSAPGYTSAHKTSGRTKAVVAGVFAERPTPTITGQARVGSRLEVRAGTWSPNPKLSYQWRVNGSPVRGATARTFTPRSGDHGKRITATVTARRDGYTTTSRTSARTAVVAIPFRSAPIPTITGTARVGTTLTARVGTWSPSPTLRYQWFANGTAIPGATKRSFTPTSTQHNARITVRVTGSRSAYVTRHRTSAATARVAPPAPALRSDGLYRVGTHIKPGTYVASSGDGCYWERRDRAGTSFAGIIANDFNTKGRVIVTISSTDKYFQTSRCGSWTRLMPNNSRASTFSDGTHAVGNHVRPGTYRTSGGSGCYWARTRNFSGNLDAIIENNFSSGRARQEITIRTGEGVSSSRCGTWTRIS